MQDQIVTMEHLLTIAAFLLAVITANAAKIPDPRIVNGESATRGQFPWQAGVISGELIPNGISLHYCGGAIISEKWILTAASCISNATATVVMYNAIDIEGNDGIIQLTIDNVIHEDFELGTLRNDIALVQVREPIIFNDNVSPIALAEEELQPDTTVTVAGWGDTKDDDAGHRYNDLRYINVTTIDNQECAEAYGSSVITDAIVCTESGNPVKSPCFGDGGDPVVVYRDDGPVHVALFSFLSGYGCENGNYPAGYTRTSYYRNWIRNVTGV